MSGGGGGGSFRLEWAGKSASKTKKFSDKSCRAGNVLKDGANGILLT